MPVPRPDEDREGELRGEAPGWQQEDLPEEEGVRECRQHSGQQSGVAHLGQERQESQQLGANVGVALQDPAEAVHGPGQDVDP